VIKAEKLIASEVACDEHPEEHVQWFDIRSKNLQCEKCLNQWSLPIQADRRVIEGSCSKLLDLIQRKKAKVIQEY
jgi:hypothetical protein